ncbi:hypothetical protein DMB66_45530 [Actinoplanes sp. ATCC 53533]|uniref:STAS domain-containing protein n=1 Tax=Actinoplanes sp. ATCC 53533 TaxID=1288362 RepID=UPI000F7A3708|nr:STAS domain-containing protein [Actinoplanes sp. ATCC 53533]RSM48929.1 hypothetical protein DMB66_45530 [Actinoplanes sp. ATCC 53533]
MQRVSIDVGLDRSLEVVLRGEVDFTNAATSAEAIRAAIVAERPTAVRVDLAEVTFLDSSGIGVLVQAMKAAAAFDAIFRVEQPTDKVLDQLDTAGLLEPFGVTRS